MSNYEYLSVEELLKIIIMEKTGEYTSKELVSNYKSLQELILEAEETELIKVKGVGIKRAQQIKAICEIARRLYSASYTDAEYKITQPQDAANLLMPVMLYLKQEVLKVVLLNTKNIVMDIVTVSMGSLNSSIVHPRETFSPAIRRSAASIIIAHNHCYCQ